MARVRGRARSPELPPLQRVAHQSVDSAVPGNTRESFEALVAPLRKSEVERLDFETVQRRKDGSLYDVAIRLQLMRDEPVNPQVVVYLNRLSDLLFVLARTYNKGRGDVLWRPGLSQSP